jgi:haloalkane dehalogenase
MGASGKPGIGYHFTDHARYLDALRLREVILVGPRLGRGARHGLGVPHPGRARGWC